MNRKTSHRINFIKNIDKYKNNSEITLISIDCNKCTNKDKLFNVFSKQLEFPDYFGKNWDAFNDCIFDLRWIKYKYKNNGIYIHMYNIEHLLEENSHDKKNFYSIINTDYYTNPQDENDNDIADIHFLINKDEKEFFLCEPISLLFPDSWEEVDKMENKYEGLSIDEYISNCVKELNIDAIGLWQIIRNKIVYNLDDNEIEELLYRTIMKIIEAGASPVFGMKEGECWMTTEKYGTEPEEIAMNVINEWKKTKETYQDISDIGGLWFAKPHIYNKIQNPK